MPEPAAPTPKDPPPKDPPPKDPPPKDPPAPAPKPPAPSPKPPAPSPSHKPTPSPAPAPPRPPPSPSPSPRSSFSFPFHPSDIPSQSRGPSIPPLSTATVTSIIHPESTLPVPVSIPVVDSFGVSIGFSTPAVITSLATTTSNGATVVVTHILANPSSAPNSSSANRSFFDDSGKTAGVFLVVGIVVTALLFGLFFLFRRHRRKNKQAEWLATLPPRHNDDPFKDPRSFSPLMRESSGPTDRSSIWDTRRVPVPEYFVSDMPVPSQPPPPPPPLPAPTPQRSPNPVWQPHTPSPPRPPPRNPNHRLNTRIAPVRRGDFDYDDPREPSPVGVAITTDRAEKHERRRSLNSVMSSPSIYPQTLPEEDNNSLYETETRRPMPPLPEHQQYQQVPQQQQQQQQQQSQQHMIFPASIRRSDGHDPKRTSLNTRVMMLTPPLTDDSEAASPSSPDFDRRRMVLPSSESSNAYQKSQQKPLSMRLDGPYPDLRSSYR